MTDGFYYTHSDGRRDWVESPPRCSKCGGTISTIKLASFEDVNEGDPVAEGRCDTCGDLKGTILKPSQEAVEFGRMLAKKYGW